MAADTKPSLVMGLIVPLLVLTLAAAGGGAMIGMQIVASLKPAHAPEPEAAPKDPSVSVVKELTPIVANLTGPDGAIVRLQTAIVYDRKNSQEMEVTAARISDDLLAFIKTLSMAQIQGASGLQHLREDLNERAIVRSDGRVREVMIETLVVQ